MHLESDKYGWHLPREVQKLWKNFEQTSRGAAHALSVHVFKTCPRFKGLWNVPEKPGSFGYFEAHKSEVAARTAIAESISGFVIYMSYMAFLVTLCQVDPSNPHFNISLATVFENAAINVHREWIRCIEPFVSPHIKRLGCIVDINSCAWAVLVPHMIEAQIPIWLFWGRPPFTLNDLLSWARPLIPQLRASQNISSSTMPATHLPSASLDSFPPVKPNTRQRPGETMRAFFQRRKVNHAHRRLKETQAKRAERLHSLKQQVHKPTPGKRGPKVYAWEKVDGSDFRIRTIMQRGLIEQTWAHIPNDQKFYDSFDKEWDCCSEWSFDPNEGEETFTSNQMEWDSGSESDDFPPYIPSNHPSSAPQAATKDSATYSQAEPVPNEESTSIWSVPCTATEIPCDRHPSSTTIALNSDMEVDEHIPHDIMSGAPSKTAQGEDVNKSGTDSVLLAADSALELAPLMEDIVTSKDTLEGHDHRSEDALRDDEDHDLDLFTASRDDVLALTPLASTVRTLARQDTFDELMFYRYGYTADEAREAGLSGHFADTGNRKFKTWKTVLYSVGGNRLANSETEQPAVADFLHILSLSERPFHDVPGKYWDLSPGNNCALKLIQEVQFWIEIRYFDGITLCLLRPRKDAVGLWYIAVYPMIALEIIRRRLGPSELDVLEYLVDHGIPFRTLAPVSRSLPRNLPPPTSTPLLGAYDIDYVFDLADYARYEALRDEVVLSMPECRHALCYGGIVARLAREILPNSVVFEGPSQSALDGQQAVFVDQNGRHMVDDWLIESISDLMSGTYQVYTGKGGMLFCSVSNPLSHINLF